MLDELLKSLDAVNGITEDIWLRILGIVGDEDPVINNVHCYGGRYYITNVQRARLLNIIPFLNGAQIGSLNNQLALPPHIELSHPPGVRCGRCGGPFHPATGHAFNTTVVACGPCYGKFAVWQMEKHGDWKSITPTHLKKIRKRKAIAARKAEKAAKVLERQQLKKAAEHDKLYGTPKEAQPAVQV